MFFKSKNSNQKRDAVAEAPTAAEAPPPLPEIVQDEPIPQADPQFQERLARSEKLHAAFGEVVSLLMQSPQFNRLPLSIIDQLVVPPLMAGQIMIARANDKKTGLVAPAAALIWANVSEDVDQRLSAMGGKKINISPGDWKSGDIPWLIVAVGNERLIKTLLQRMQQTVLKGRPLKSLSFSEGEERKG